MNSLLLAFAASCLVTFLLIRSEAFHGRFSRDHDTTGPQKFHVGIVPRVGGIGIFCGLIACVTYFGRKSPHAVNLGMWLLLCGLPAFAAGIAEDVTKRVTPRHRLLATAAAAGLASFLLDASLGRTSIPGLDWVVSFPLAAGLVTMFVVAGVANAFNIIDGFNGLASMCVMLALGAIAFVAWRVGDESILDWALAGIGATLGFFVWNFPSGSIFLGDGGAYFLGFYVAELAILLVRHNPAVSPMFALLICIYPVFETVFSIYRKKLLRNMSPGLPDGVHLHMLVYKRMVRPANRRLEPQAAARRNSRTSFYLWTLCLLSILPALALWDSTAILAVCIVAFGVLYVIVYWSIVRFHVPRLLVHRGMIPRSELRSDVLQSDV